MPRVRVHQHVNPLAPYYRFTPQPVEINKVYLDPTLPILLDIGCARGRFLQQMAEIDKSQNFLGIEIREPLVIEANRLAQMQNLRNLHYEFCNAMLSLDILLQKLPVGRLMDVTIQFPDPWFKKKHAKRRMVNRELVETVVKHLAADGRIFVQTDIEFLANEMFELLKENNTLSEQQIDVNPFPVKTEREKAVEEKNLPIYRRLFLKK